MVRVTVWLQLLPLVCILRQSAAGTDVGGADVGVVPGDVLTRVKELELQVSQYYVISRHYDTATCSLMV
jgi:hypothetical protein